MLANEFAEMTVNIQDDRGQKSLIPEFMLMCDIQCIQGLFFYSRHKSLVRNLPFIWYLSDSSDCRSLFQNSIEEKTLINELDGYQDYLKKVKFKVIPFII